MFSLHTNKYMSPNMLDFNYVFDSKNCKGNPNCYNYLGEKAWIEKNLDEDLKDAVIESCRGIRTPVSFPFLNFRQLLKIYPICVFHVRSKFSFML